MMKNFKWFRNLELAWESIIQAKDKMDIQIV